MSGSEFGGGVAALLMTGLFILGVILAVAWIILPFAIVGTKPILRELLAEQKKATAALEHLARSSDEQRKSLAALLDRRQS